MTGEAAAYAEVVGCVVRERRARDTARWAEMLECFHPDSVVDISWIRTSGPDFVERSRAAFEVGTHSVHLLGPLSATISGDRALADVGAQIAIQVELDGTPCAVSAFVRFAERLERRDGAWRIVEFQAVYQFDDLRPAIPGEVVTLDREQLRRYRPSYRMLSHIVARTQGEAAVRHELAGIDRPDLVASLYERYERWLGA